MHLGPDAATAMARDRPPSPHSPHTGAKDSSTAQRDDVVREAVLAAAGLGLSEKRMEMTDTFQPGPLGITYWPKTGLVTEVFEGGQAQRHGVQVGWFVESIAGEPYSHKTFVTYRHHDKPYSVTFVS